MTEFNLDTKYTPHSAQLPFHHDGYKVRYRGVFGGTGSGKTLAGVAEDVRWLLENPGIVGYIFEPTIPMVKQILIPTLEKILDPLKSSPLIKRFHKGDLHITLKNNSQLWLRSLEKPEMAEGTNIDFVHVNEARLVRRFAVAWRVIERRLRGSGGGYPNGAWVTTTPNSPGSYLHGLFENPKTRLKDSRVYRLPLTSNQANLPKEYIDEVKRAHTGNLYLRFVEGIFAAEEAGTYPFDYATHVQNYKEPLPGDRRIAFGVDFGWTNPTAIVVVLFDRDERAFVAEEIYQSRLSEDDLSRICLELKQVWGDGTFWCDPSEPRTIKALRERGLNAEPSKHRRDEGIREVGGRLNDAGDNKCRLYIAPTCVNLIDEMQSYDAKRREHDHAVDALRYCLVEEGKQKKEWAFYFGGP